MRFLLSVLLTAVLSFIAGLFLPWWSIAIIAFGVALLLRPRPASGFLAGFLGILLLWGLLAFWIDQRNQGILSSKVARLFSLGESPLLIILVTAVVGGLVGGFAALTGSALYKAPRR